MPFSMAKVNKVEKVNENYLAEVDSYRFNKIKRGAFL